MFDEEFEDLDSLFTDFFVAMDYTEAEEKAVMDVFNSIDYDGKNLLIKHMMNVIYEVEIDWSKEFQSFLELWEEMTVEEYKECEGYEYPCFIPDNGCVLN